MFSLFPTFLSKIYYSAPRFLSQGVDVTKQKQQQKTEEDPEPSDFVIVQLNPNLFFAQPKFVNRIKKASKTKIAPTSFSDLLLL